MRAAALALDARQLVERDARTLRVILQTPERKYAFHYSYAPGLPYKPNLL
jgi:hypothetical protein